MEATFTNFCFAVPSSKSNFEWKGSKMKLLQVKSKTLVKLMHVSQAQPQWFHKLTFDIPLWKSKRTLKATDRGLALLDVVGATSFSAVKIARGTQQKMPPFAGRGTSKNYLALNGSKCEYYSHFYEPYLE